jgi:hypothetical protein
MAETTKASTGAKSEFWFNDGAALYKAVQVKAFSCRAPRSSSSNRPTLTPTPRNMCRATPISAFEVKINLRPGSDTDTKIEAWVAAQTERAFLANIAVRGVLTRSYAGNAIRRGL